MNITSRPDSLCLVGAMNHFVIASDKEISFILKYADTEDTIIQHTYVPDKLNRIDVDLESVISPLLSFRLQDVSEPYAQPHIVRKFTACITAVGESSGESCTFSVIRAGVDHFADTAFNFLKANFLTWQPTVKPVTYYTPEFLTYYAVIDAICKCKVYIQNTSGGYDEHILTLANLGKDTAWTIPVQYAVIAGKVSAGQQGAMPAFYDVWIENAAGERLTYIQRYYAADIRSEEEQWILFENSLGGIDTFRAYGDTELEGKHTHNIAEIEQDVEEYRVDTDREYKKNTGHLNAEERRWLLDFFPSLGKYIYIDAYVRRIVVTESDVSYRSSDLPSNYTFTYKYADARPYLNIPRMQLPAKMLEIKVPDVGSFTIAPRLVEFDRLTLSGGALFPVQSPYSQAWKVTTAAALFDFFAKQMVVDNQNDGAFGHTHDNMDVLAALGRMGRYLTLEAGKISAGYADTAHQADTLTPASDVWDKVLRKDLSDTARALITFLKGIALGTDYGITEEGVATLRSLVLKAAGIDEEGNISGRSLEFAKASIDALGNIVATALRSGDFNPGLLDGKGFGIYTDENGRTVAEIDRLLVRMKAVFAELEIRRLSYVGGDNVFSSAGSKIEHVRLLDSGDYRCYFLADDGTTATTNWWKVGDQARCQTFNIKAGVHENVANRYFWRLVVGTGDEELNGKVYHYADLSNTKGTVRLNIDGEEHLCVGYDTSVENDAPAAGDAIVQLGSQTDPDRQYAYIIYVTEQKRVDYNGINDYDLASHVTEVHSASGTVVRSDRFEIISASGTGQSAPIVCERGEWVSGAIYGHYDHVSHGNATWLCNAGKGQTTTEEPHDGSTVWIKETYGVKGEEVTRLLLGLSSGSWFYRDGQENIAVIVAEVVRGSTDITSTLHPSQFVWTRESSASESDDADWAARHTDISTTLVVTAADMVGNVTTFVCTLLDRNNRILETEKITI